MPFVAVNEYIELLSDPEMYARTLGAVDVLIKDASGRPCCFVGNRSAVFKIRRGDGAAMLKCYTSPAPRIRRIYGAQCLRDELFVPSGGMGGRWVDVVVSDWVEGRTLAAAIADAAGDTQAMGRLARSFGRFALELLDAEWAHGDLKPENIIVDGDGAMHAVDFDAVWRPDLADMGSDESGTAAFQHPLRTPALYDKCMDDYPVALICTALHALSLDAELHRHLQQTDRLLLLPCEIVNGRSEFFTKILEIFSQACCGALFRIANLLLSPVPQLPRLRDFMAMLRAEVRTSPAGEAPALSCDDGLWGYRSADGSWAVPPVFDEGFEFSEGLAAVRLGRWHHYIDAAGSSHLSLGDCDAVKPFIGGEAVIIRRGERFTVSKNDMAIYPPPTVRAEN